MTERIAYRLSAVSVLDIAGTEATKIANNLTTNELAKLVEGQGCETFVTDVRGKTLGHVLVFHQGDALRWIGAPGQSEGLAAHLDRYIIREDAEPRRRDDEFAAIVMSRATSESLQLEPPDAVSLHAFAGPKLGTAPSAAYICPWLGDGSVLLLIASNQVGPVTEWLSGHSVPLAGEDEFHQRRTLIGFPWYGVDLDEKNLPQEADRNREAISFTKGCYLGQETVARLDALGQVQKKLVRWTISGSVPSPGATVESGGKAVGRLTSIAVGGEQDAVAIGMARRSHFDPGAVATGTDPDSGQPFEARVL